MGRGKRRDGGRGTGGGRELVSLDEKIFDPRLHRLAVERSDEHASVIIELDGLEPQIDDELAPDGERGASLGRVVACEADATALEDAVNEVRVFLERLLGERPVHLRAARAFVATVNGRQLAEITRCPLVSW